jgi:hypothetical protein
LDCRRRRCRPKVRRKARPRFVRPTGPRGAVTRADTPTMEGRGTRPLRVGRRAIAGTDGAGQQAAARRRLHLGAGGVGVGDGVAGGRSGVGSARQRGRNWVAVSRPTIGSASGDRSLTSGFGGAPRGIRTPNRQIRSQPSPVPTRPSGPCASPLVLVNGPVARPSRGSVPARHAWLGRNVVAVSGQRRQTGRLVTGRSPGCAVQSTRFKIWCSTPRKDENQSPALLKSRSSRPSEL